MFHLHHFHSKPAVIIGILFYPAEDYIATAKPTNIINALSFPSPVASTKRLSGLLKFNADLNLNGIKCILIFAIVYLKTSLSIRAGQALFFFFVRLMWPCSISSIHPLTIRSVSTVLCIIVFYVVHCSSGLMFYHSRYIVTCNDYGFIAYIINKR